MRVEWKESGRRVEEVFSRYQKLSPKSVQNCNPFFFSITSEPRAKKRLDTWDLEKMMLEDACEDIFESCG